MEHAEAVESVAGFRNDLRAHLAHGIVHACPEFIILLRAVPRSAPVEQLVNPWWSWPDAECDTWYIWLLAGNGARALDVLVPIYGVKKWVAFQTSGPPKFWKFNKLSLLWPKVLTTQQQSASSANP
jgi:hypothetical protein